MTVKLNYKFLLYGIILSIFLVTLIQLNYFYKENYLKHKTRDEIYEDIKSETKLPQTLFVSIASYRDTFCSDTLNFLFSKAEHPENIFVGLVDQGSELIPPSQNSTEFMFPNSYCYRNLKPRVLEYVEKQVRRVALTIDESLGPTYARYLATTMYRNETYFMQIDSHTRFIDGWDTAMINDYWLTVKYAPQGRNGMPRTVLTYYPRSFNASEPGIPDDDQTQVPRICQGVFNDRGIMTFRSFILKAVPEPIECPFVAAGYLFTSGEALDLVPYDPYLPNLFEGEEILYAARLYIAGFKFYGPTLNFCFHYYTRSGAPKFWEDNHQYYISMMKSLEKVKYILGWNDGKTPNMSDPIYTDFDKYTIHDRVKLDEYYTHYGINYQNRSHDHTKWCLP